MRKTSEEITNGISDRNMRARAATVRRVARAEGELNAVQDIERLLIAHDDSEDFLSVMQTWAKVARETAEQELEL